MPALIPGPPVSGRDRHQWGAVRKAPKHKQTRREQRRGPPEELKALDPGTGQVCASQETVAGPGTAGEGIPVTFSPGWSFLWFRSE